MALIIQGSEATMIQANTHGSEWSNVTARLPKNLSHLLPFTHAHRPPPELTKPLRYDVLSNSGPC